MTDAGLPMIVKQKARLLMVKICKILILITVTKIHGKLGHYTNIFVTGHDRS